MHELSLLHGVVVAVEKAAKAAHASRVEAVGMRVGALNDAVPEALREAWPLATVGTIAQGATLNIDEVPALVWCPSCRENQPIDMFFALVCPVCGTPTGHLVSGREFEVVYADLEQGDIPARPSQL